MESNFTADEDGSPVFGMTFRRLGPRSRSFSSSVSSASVNSLNEWSLKIQQEKKGILRDLTDLLILSLSPFPSPNVCMLSPGKHALCINVVFFVIIPRPLDFVLPSWFQIFIEILGSNEPFPVQCRNMVGEFAPTFQSSGMS